MLRSSIRNRLLFGMGALMALILSICTLLLYFTVKQTFYNRVDHDLTKLTALLLPEIEIQGNKVVHEWLDDIEENPSRKKQDLIQIWDVNTGQVTRSPALGEFHLPKLFSNLDEPVFQDITLPGNKAGRALGVKFIILPNDEDQGGGPSSFILQDHPQIMVIAVDIEEIVEALQQMRLIMVGTFMAALAFSGLVISTIINSSLAPISTLTDWIKHKDENLLGERSSLEKDFPLELIGLATEYNKLLDRIDKARTRERDFSAHAAHELRTPLAGIRATLEQTLTRDRTVLEYKNSSNETYEIAKQMSDTVNRLMQFSRIQNQNYIIAAQEIHIHEQLDLAWNKLKGKAQNKNLTVKWELNAKPDTLMTDHELIRILFSNLIDNALSYAPESSEITIQSFRCERAFHLSICNLSDYISDDDMNRLFDPFYRKDKVRGASEGHSGIGLSLAREIVKALDGKIDLSFENDKMFVVKLTLQAPGA